MPKRITITAVAALLLCLGLAVPFGYAQGKCTLQTLAGSYAMYEKGSSAILDPSQPPEYQPYYLGAIAPFVNIAHVTMNDKGVGEGYYWIRIGSIHPGYDPIPLHITVTELNEDCTGKLRYEVSLPGIPLATIEERFVAFDNGRELRSIPTVIQNGIPDMAWVNESHRISNSETPVTSCGPHTVKGTYVVTCESIVALTPDIGMADSAIAVTHNTGTGDFTGRLYEKAGMLTIDTPIRGTVTVNPDCSATIAMQVPEFFGDMSITTKAIYFDEGKQTFQLPIDMPTAFCRGKRVGP